MSAPDPNRVEYPITDALDVLRVRREGMSAAQRLGFSQADATKVAVVISELARNIVNYAGKGVITLTASEGTSAERASITIQADDHGPGIKDLDAALAGGQSTAGGLGLGLSGSRRMMDEFEIHSKAGEGTHVRAVKWL